MKKKLISLALTLALVLTVPVTAAAQSQPAAGRQGIDAVKSATNYYNRYLQTVVFDEGAFKKDSAEYDPHLAMMSFDISELACNSRRYYEGDSSGYLSQSRNIREYLEDNGFEDFSVNEDYTKPIHDKTIAVACAHKTVYQNGKPYTLLAIVPRGGTSGAGEWIWNFTISESASDTNDYAGYRLAKEKILTFVRQYIVDNGISGDLKVWTSGYSRGAGIVGLLGGDIARDPKTALGSSISLMPEDLYCYTFGSMRSTVTKDYDSPVYKGIHNLYQDDDVVANLIPDGFGFERYGQNHQFSDFTDKERMLAFLNIRSSGTHSSYMANDPEGFTTYKLDSEALMNGSLNMIPDEDSYLPDNQADYVRSISASIDRLAARSSRSGTKSREGFYRDYQDAAIHFLTYTRSTGEANLIGGLKDSQYTIPLVLSMYVTFMIDKSVSDSDAAINGNIEDAFNALAFVMEDADGGIRPEFAVFGRTYRKILSVLVSEDPKYSADDADDASVTDPPHRYKLNYKFVRKSLLLTQMKALTAKLYSAVLKDALTASGASEETIAQLTSDKDSAAMSYALTCLALGNVLQSKKTEPFSFENEQFKQLATFAGNFARYAVSHDSYVIESWLRAADPLYENYSLPDDSQLSGYRRIYIRSTDEGVDVSGSVTDADGNVIAEFENDILLSSADEWIGITHCDSGSWLRLPADKAYKVNVTVSSDSAVDVKAGDYSLNDGKLIRTIMGDGELNWSGIGLGHRDILTMDVPAAEKSGSRYVLTSVQYSIDIQKDALPEDQEDQTGQSDQTVQDYLNGQEAQDINNDDPAANGDGSGSDDQAVTNDENGGQTDAADGDVIETGEGTVTPPQAADDQEQTAPENCTVKEKAKKVKDRLSKLIPCIKAAKVKAGKRSVTVRWNKLSAKQLKKLSRIQVQISTNKNFKNSKTYNIKKTLKSKTIKGLKKGKTYYVRVRSIKTGSKVNYVSGWSKVMKVKVK